MHARGPRAPLGRPAAPRRARAPPPSAAPLSQVPLLICTFQTLLKFLNWIPLGYIFETALVKNLVYKFLPHQAFRNDVLACLTEIGSLDIGTIYESLTGELGAAYDTHFEALFTEVRIPPRPPSRPWTDPETTPHHTCARPH